MMEVLQHPYISTPIAREARKTIVHQFLDWCKAQEKNRLLWLAVIIVGHGCLVTPFTLLFVLSSGNSMLLWAMVMAAMGMTLVTNLAAMPTKITIPIFFLSLIIDLVVIGNCIATGLAFPV